MFAAPRFAGHADCCCASTGQRNAVRPQPSVTTNDSRRAVEAKSVYASRALIVYAFYTEFAITAHRFAGNADCAHAFEEQRNAVRSQSSATD